MKGFTPYKVTFGAKVVLVYANDPTLALDFTRLVLRPSLGRHHRIGITVALPGDVEWAKLHNQDVYVVGKWPGNFGETDNEETDARQLTR